MLSVQKVHWQFTINCSSHSNLGVHCEEVTSTSALSNQWYLYKLRGETLNKKIKQFIKNSASRIAGCVEELHMFTDTRLHQQRLQTVGGEKYCEVNPNYAAFRQTNVIHLFCQVSTQSSAQEIAVPTTSILKPEGVMTY